MAVETEELLAVLAESAATLGLEYAPDNVEPVFTAYRDELANAMVIVGIPADGGGELDVSFGVPLRDFPDDPYELARSRGFVQANDHPVANLLGEVLNNCPVYGYGVDCGIDQGFKKIYAAFPLEDLQGIAKLAALPSMPPSVAEHVDSFTHWGIADNVSMFAIDYLSRSVNIYFGKLPDGVLKSETVLSILGEIGIPEPSEQMMEFVGRSFSIYPTFSWDTGKVERICFSIVTPDPIPLPTRGGPEIERFLANAPHTYTGKPIIVYAGVLSPSGSENYKLGWYYQEPQTMWRKLEVFNAVAGGG